MDNRGRIYVGTPIREALQIGPGDKILFYDGPEGIVYMVKPPAKIMEDDEDFF